MRKRVLLIAAIMVALLLGAGVTWAAIPSSDGVIHGCYRTSNPAVGSLIVIDAEAGQTCPSGTAPLNWKQSALSNPKISINLIQIGPNQFGTASVNCPSNSLALGGGFRTGGLVIDVTESRPLGTGPNATIPIGWTATAINTSADQTDSLSAWVICGLP
jgi:hypothetical protein